ncbi:MAG TPA: hypothetical protein VF080_16405 [Solirubrobacteraceae bacterium]
MPTRRPRRRVAQDRGGGTPALRRQVGYVTQAPSVYGDLTTRENLRYFARVLGAPEARVDEAIATVDLGEHADRVAHSLRRMPAVVFPQLLLCGLFVARDEMAAGLRAASAALPPTYAFDAIDRVTGDGRLGGRGAIDVAVVAGCTVLALALGAATLRRRTA